MNFNVQLIFPDPLSAFPDEQRFRELVISEIETKWEDFGIAVKIECSTLDGIRQNRPECCKDRFIEVFKTWKRTGCSEFTWEKVIEVLQSKTLKENTLAENLKRTIQSQRRPSCPCFQFCCPVKK